MRSRSPVYRLFAGHAEAVLLSFDSEQTSFHQIVKTIFSKFDMTTLNRQGSDRGPQYRSAIFYLTDAQRQEAEELIELENRRLETTRRPWDLLSRPKRESPPCLLLRLGCQMHRSCRLRPPFRLLQVVTQVVPLGPFWPAEEGHQNFYGKGAREEAIEAEFEHFLWATDIDQLNV